MTPPPPPKKKKKKKHHHLFLECWGPKQLNMDFLCKKKTMPPPPPPRIYLNGEDFSSTLIDSVLGRVV